MSDRKQFRTLTPPEELRDIVAGLGIDPGIKQVPLSEARGRVLAERLDAPLDVPGFDRASVDGYALRASDTTGASETNPVSLPAVGTVHAGEEPDATVGPGECVQISTGAVVPSGADAVVMVEQTNENGDVRLVQTALTPGSGIMPAGADISAGDRALPPGTRLTARETGLLAALGIESVPVRARPTVAIISTGDELVPVGEPLDSSTGQIHDVNAPTIAAAVAAAGGEPKRYPHVGDDFDAMADLLERASEECDLVLSSGSTSASAVDVVYRVIEETGELLVHGVAVKPGKPLLVGELGEGAYVGLPGYPVSALTTFRVFVAPAIREAAGRPEPERATLAGEMAVEERFEPGRLRYVPVGVTTDGGGDRLVYPVDKGSGATTSLTDADGVVAMAPETQYLAAGESVTVELFSPDVRPPALLGMGASGPGVSRLLDSVSPDRGRPPRYLARGEQAARSWLSDDVPDFLVTSEEDTGGETMGAWSREWGLVVPRGNPADVTDIGDLTDEVRLVRQASGTGLHAAFETLADDAPVGATGPGVESPARQVIDGRADVGVGLRATAERVGLGFVPLGTQRLHVVVNPSRTEKSAVARLEDAVSGLSVEGLAGYERVDAPNSSSKSETR
ncbi:molybdopterin biosynthesis protein [Halosegnis rubeus]|uniref:Molybdopterin biosynthesis protein n=1 Tax=Halosegnis rubeus TaxID=2212850 RepID=A0A5N5U8L5_9EURY|nr:molybdopterin biosynthesis protein [Halosegnis rubeus]KAB7514965.1 molybdopterin biosynthesis protein [Halosegnis rubeus]